jgi:hypothetical protein
MTRKRFFHSLSLLSFLGSFLSAFLSHAFDPYLSPRLGVSLRTLQATLEKVESPVAFTPRPGSQQGTQEARLSRNAGIVQAGSDSENLAVVVLWLPIDTQGKLVGSQAQAYLSALVRLFLPESAETLRWVEQVLQRAVADTGKDSYVESRLSEKHQLKVMYVPTLSPPMFSLTVTAAEEGGLR